MTATPPTLIAIDHDDHYAEHVGRTGDGRQFFLTTPFVAAGDGRAGSEYVAFFLFSAAGQLLEAKINDFGPRVSMNRAQRRACCEQHLRELGKVTFRRIQIAPFAVARFGTTFGLIPRRVDHEGNSWWTVELAPGNYMAFYEPWDSGIYDT